MLCGFKATLGERQQLTPADGVVTFWNQQNIHEGQREGFVLLPRPVWVVVDDPLHGQQALVPGVWRGDYERLATTIEATIGAPWPYSCFHVASLPKVNERALVFVGRKKELRGVRWGISPTVICLIATDEELFQAYLSKGVNAKGEKKKRKKKRGYLVIWSMDTESAGAEKLPVLTQPTSFFSWKLIEWKTLIDAFEGPMGAIRMEGDWFHFGRSGLGARAHGIKS